jgi:(p)ppGpp synthase/HD superfamily hydrolase
VPLTYVLNNGDKVEIITAKHTSRDWLVPSLGFWPHPAAAQSPCWFRKQDEGQNIAQGR